MLPAYAFTVIYLYHYFRVLSKNKLWNIYLYVGCCVLRAEASDTSCFCSSTPSRFMEVRCRRFTQWQTAWWLNSQKRILVLNWHMAVHMQQWYCRNSDVFTEMSLWMLAVCPTLLNVWKMFTIQYGNCTLTTRAESWLSLTPTTYLWFLCWWELEGDSSEFP